MSKPSIWRNSKALKKPRHRKGIKKAEAQKRLKVWFEKFEISDWWDKKVEELSKGMQQKVQFIVTVIHEPKLLIFDEPFSGFDPINVNLLKNEILELRDKGATILFSTHNMASVEELCDNIMLINKGEKILEGSVYDIKQQYKNHSYDIVYKPFDGSGEQHLTVNTTNPNELIQDIINKGELVSFNEILPSMNEIFINLVSSSNQQNQ